MIKIATWNVNSVNARLPHLLAWLSRAQPDVLCLQEIKCVSEAFPLAEVNAAGYQCAVLGQKSYNGVALLSRLPLTDVQQGLPGMEDDPQARYIEATINDTLRVASLYLPNGNPVDSDKYPYKLKWMQALSSHAARLRRRFPCSLLAGDYNICPEDRDVYDPPAWQDDASCRIESRLLYQKVLHDGWTDAFRAVNQEPQRFSFWDYQAGAWQKDNGLRIDHLLLSPALADLLITSDIDKSPRGQEKASDHTPVWCTLDL